MIEALTRVCISLFNLTAEKLILKLLMHKNNIFWHIYPSLGWLLAAVTLPLHLHRSVKAYISTKEEIMMTKVVSLCVCLSFPFLFFPFLSPGSFFSSFLRRSFFFPFWGGGGPAGLGSTPAHGHGNSNKFKSEEYTKYSETWSFEISTLLVHFAHRL